MEFEQIREVIMETLNCDARCVTPEARLREDLGADSLAAVELCMAMEEASGLTIDDTFLPNMITVNDILEYWKEHTK